MFRRHGCRVCSDCGHSVGHWDPPYVGKNATHPSRPSPDVTSSVKPSFLNTACSRALFPEAPSGCIIP